jgi:hypothetical protein
VKEYVSRWAPETVGAFWKREKSLGSAGNWTTYPWSASPQLYLCVAYTSV